MSKDQPTPDDLASRPIRRRRLFPLSARALRDERGLVRALSVPGLLFVTALVMVAVMLSSTWGDESASASGTHTDLPHTVTASFNDATDTWTYTFTANGDPEISHVLIAICLDDDELADAGGIWSPPYTEYGTDGSTGFTGFKWDTSGSKTITLTIPGYSSVAGGAEAVIKAGPGHEHFSLIGPDCNPPVPEPDVTVTKTGNGTVPAGTAVTFDILVTNLGPGAATNVTVSDTLPAGLTWTESSDPSNFCSIAAGVLSCTIPALADGASYTVSVQAATTVDDCDSYPNTVTVGADNEDPTKTGNNSASDTVTVTCPDPDPNIDVSKHSTPETTVGPGGAVAWNVTISVTGAPASGTVTDTVPAGFTIDSVVETEASISCTGAGVNPVVCMLTSTPIGVYNVTINTTAPDGDPAGECTTYTNSVEVTTGDINGGQNSDTDTIDVECAPALTLTKDPSSATVGLGGTFTYSIVVTNTGNATATNLQVTDTLSGNGAITDITTSVASANSCEGTNTFPCDFASLAAGASITITVEVTAGTERCEPIDNSSTVTADGNLNATDNTDNQVQVTGCAPNLTLTKDPSSATVALGGTFTYSIVVTNTGNANATNLQVTDTLSGNGAITDIATSVASTNNCEDTNTFPCDFASLAAGASITITVTVQAGDQNCEPIDNSSTVTADGNLTATDNTGNEVDVTGCAPGFEFSKTPSTGSVVQGGTFTYTIEVENTGNAAATNVQVTDTLTGNGVITDIATSVASSNNCEGNDTFPCNFASLAAGASITITVEVTAGTDTCEPIDNTSSMTADGGASATDSTDNEVSVTGCQPGVDTQVSTATVNLAAGETVFDTATFTPDPNLGDVEGTVTFYVCGPDANSNPDCNLEPLTQVGDPKAVAANQAVSDPFTPTQVGFYCFYLDFVPAQGSPYAGTSHTNQTTECFQVVDPDLDIDKDGPATLNLGDGGTYTVTVTNNGSGPTVDPIAVSDTLPDGLLNVAVNEQGEWDCAPDAIAGPTSGDSITCTYTGTGGILAAGDSSFFTIDFEVPDDECPTLVNQVAFVDNDETQNTNTSDSVTTDVDGCASDVDITKADSQVVLVGDEVTFTLTVTNDGTADALDVVVTDNLPNDLDNVVATWDTVPPAGATACAVGAGNNVSCDIATLGVGESIVVTITGDVTDCDDFTNTATVSWLDDATGPDSDTSNTVTVTVNCGSITIAKDTDPETAGPDFNFTGSFGPFTLEDGDSILFDEVEPGDFTVTESGLPADWDLTAITCDNGAFPGAADVTVNLATETVVIDLRPGEDVTCLFNNVFDPPVIITEEPTPTPTPVTEIGGVVVTPTPTPTLVSEIGGVVVTPTPALISEILQVRRLPGTGTGGPAGETGSTPWLLIVAASSVIAALLTVLATRRRQAERR
jgi:uncharacterized repeat protein (TIGR01451 family)